MSVRPELTRPLCNRVTPFGEIVRHPARGTLFGNRGCLHDEQGSIVRSAPNQAWITCRLPTSGWTRDLMYPGHYTELFFLDEATALAAGHRPCGYCQSERLDAFKQAWKAAQGLSYLPKVNEMDATIRREQRAAFKTGDWRELPNGAMVTDAKRSACWLVRKHKLYRWDWHGYLPDTPAAEPDRVITVPSILAALGAGQYRYSSMAGINTGQAHARPIEPNDYARARIY